MAYLKPPFFVRKIGNKFVMRSGAGGAWTLTSPGVRRASSKTFPSSRSITTSNRDTAGRTVTTYFKQLPDAADHPTFRLEAPRSRLLDA